MSMETIGLIIILAGGIGLTIVLAIAMCAMLFVVFSDDFKKFKRRKRR